ncbi:hypothetical protein CCP3SC15_5410002 [Gammaproteobacteria bacterium]
MVVALSVGLRGSVVPRVNHDGGLKALLMENRSVMRVEPPLWSIAHEMRWWARRENSLFVPVTMSRNHESCS